MESFFILLRQRFIILCLIALAATISLSPLASNIILPNSGDFVNHMSSVVQAKMAFTQGQFPLRVMPFTDKGWGYPCYQFYSPTAYAIAAAVYQWIVPSNPYVAMKITMWCAIFFGGIFMYRLSKLLVNSTPAALLSSVAYITSPYYLIVINHLSDFTEAIGLGILPAVLYYSIQFFYFPKTKFFLLMGLCWYLLATIHLITFFYATLFIALLFVLMALQTRNGWVKLLTVGLGYFFSLILSMWFLLPAALLKNKFIIETTVPIIRDKYSLPLVGLFSPFGSIAKAHSVSNVFVVVDHTNPNIGVVFLFGVGIVIYGLFNRLKINALADNFLLPLFILFICCVMFIWSPFHLWNSLPHVFIVGQYNWRLMEQLIWIEALLLAWSIAWLFPPLTLNNKKVLIGTFLILIATSNWYVMSDLPFTVADMPGMTNTPSLVLNPVSFLINDATFKGPAKANKSLTVLDVKQTEAYCHKIKNKTECVVPATDKTEVIQLPILYYPHMLDIYLNGKKVFYDAALHKKLLIATVKSEPNVVNKIEIEFTGMRSANIISWIGWIVWVSLAITLVCTNFLKLKSFKRATL